jgi:hypothetical protein
MNIQKFVAPNTLFDTSIAFLRNVTFDSSVYLQGITHISSPATSSSGTPYALVVDSIGGDVVVQSKQLGTIAFQQAADWDASLNNLESSIGALDVLTQTHTTNITNLNSSVGALDLLTQQHTTDIFDVSARVNNLDSSLDLYVLKAGDTMTGPLTISGGGLSVAGDVSITASGDLYVDGDTTIKGNLTINGSLYVVDVETIDVSGTYIHLNTGLTGAPPASLQSGIIVGRGTSDPYVFVYDESQQTFRIGIATLDGATYKDASTQAVATRQNAPLANGIAYWNSTENRFDTSTGFTIIYLQNQIAQLDASVVQNRTDIADVSTRLANFTPADLSTRIYDLETSVGALDVLTQKHDASIGFLTGWELAQDASIVALRNTNLSQDASIVILRAKDASQDASIGALDVLTQKHDVSIGYLTAYTIDLSTRIGTIDDWQGYVDGSLLQRDLSINRIDGSVNYLFNWNLSQDASIQRIDASLNDVVDITTIIDGSLAQLASDIADVSARVYTNEQDITNIETSLGTLNGLIQTNITDITNLETSVGALDVLTQKHDVSIGFLLTNLLDVSTDKISGVANINVTANASLYSYELNNIAYLKKIVAGTGATITEDTSTITIAVAGAAGYVSKYSSTFDGTANASIGVLAVTHGLGIGPLSVTVYENTAQVYADIDCDATGNIVISWAPGSLGASCKYVIMG